MRRARNMPSSKMYEFRPCRAPMRRDRATHVQREVPEITIALLFCAVAPREQFYLNPLQVALSSRIKGIPLLVAVPLST